NWDLSEEGDPRLFGCLRRLASPEDLRLLATVWAYYVAHILNQAQNLHRVQLFTQGLGHVDRLRNYHQRQILRRRDDDHSLQGKRLKYSQWGVRGSRREIWPEEGEVPPFDVLEHLADDAVNDWAAHDHRHLGF